MSAHIEQRDRLLQYELTLDSWRRIAAMYRRRLADDALDARVDDLDDTLDSLRHATRMAEDAADALALAQDMAADDLAERVVKEGLR